MGRGCLSVFSHSYPSARQYLKRKHVFHIVRMFCSETLNSVLLVLVHRDVLVLLICVHILVRLDCFSRSITMEVLKPAS